MDKDTVRIINSDGEGYILTKRGGSFGTYVALLEKKDDAKPVEAPKSAPTPAPEEKKAEVKKEEPKAEKTESKPAEKKPEAPKEEKPKEEKKPEAKPAERKKISLQKKRKLLK